MVTLKTGRWVLVEFVGGPADGMVVPIQASTVVGLTHGLVELVNTAPDYRPLKIPGAGDALDAWAERERSVVVQFDNGSPELYLQMSWRGASDEHGSKPIDIGDERKLTEQFLPALKLGQNERCLSIIRQTWTGRPVTGLIDTVLAPAMTAIGEDWAHGLLSVYAEHRATSIVRGLIAEHSPSTSNGRRGWATVAAVEVEQHTLPTEMATAALREDGWQVDHVGAAVPSADLLNGALPDYIDLMVLSVTMESSRERSVEIATALRKKGLPVLVGGPGQPLSGLQRAARAVTDQ